MRTIVLCLEGCHGSGKTELCKSFERDGIEVLDEAFLEQPAYALHPQSLVMETYWVAHWFQRLLKRHHELQKECEKTGEHFRILVADRSPFSAVFYARFKGALLENVIRAQIEELQMNAAIDLFTVSIRVEKGLLWQRIQDRLERCPERIKYNEHSYKWMEDTLAFYHNFAWDMQIDNSNGAIDDVKQDLLAKVSPHLNAVVLESLRQAERLAAEREFDENNGGNKENLPTQISPIK